MRANCSPAVPGRARPPDEGLPARPVNLTKGDRRRASTSPDRDTQAHRPKWGGSSNSINSAASHAHPFLSFSACTGACPPARARARDTCGQQTARLRALHATPTRQRPAPKVVPHCTSFPTLARAPRPLRPPRAHPHHPLKNSRVRLHPWKQRTGSRVLRCRMLPSFAGCPEPVSLRHNPLVAGP